MYGLMKDIPVAWDGWFNRIEDEEQILSQRNYRRKASNIRSNKKRRKRVLAKRCPDHPQHPVDKNNKCKRCRYNQKRGNKQKVEQYLGKRNLKKPDM